MLKDNMKKSELNLSKYATLSDSAIRLNEETNDFRTPFFRDTDRILYSLSYSRYIDKTQVFSKVLNDHISKRIIHVQFVSKVARTIGRALNLNEDLIEAMSLGHDIGHVPFGHVGESILNKISLEHNEGYFMHNVQSVRTLMNLEKNGNGVNLTVQVLDGILCHNGEKLEKKYTYKEKSKDEFLNDYNMCYKDKSHKLIPMTLEGCVVRISDIIGYIGRDIEDAMLLGIISEKDIPEDVKNILGSDNKSIINTIVLDIINNSFGKPFITMSESIYNALLKLIKFNYENIYFKANTKEQIEEYENMFRKVFEYNLENISNKDSNIYKVYLSKMNDLYIKNNSKERIVIDYIAGMTDDYFINEYKCFTKK